MFTRHLIAFAILALVVTAFALGAVLVRRARRLERLRANEPIYIRPPRHPPFKG